MTDSVQPKPKKPKLSRETFEHELENLQRELVILQEHVKLKGLKAIPFS